MNDYCPSCRAIRELRVTTESRKVPADDGTEREILFRSWFCAVCGIFVKSEEIVVGSTSKPK